MSESRFYKIDGNTYIKTTDKENNPLDLDSEEKIITQVGNYLDSVSTVKIKNERDKTAENIEAINGLDGLLKKEILNLGVSAENIRPNIVETIHFLSEEDFCNFIPRAQEIKVGAASSAARGNILICPERFSSEAQIYKALLHEMVHAQSLRILKMGDGMQNYSVEKLGYKNNSFQGLNEAITDLTVFEIIKNNRDVLKNMIGLSDDEFKKIEKNLYPYCPLVEKLVDEIAEQKQESREDVWRSFERGLFSGEIMHLRDIENLKGEGALRLIASLGYSQENDKKVFDYFSVEEANKKELSKYYKQENLEKAA